MNANQRIRVHSRLRARKAKSRGTAKARKFRRLGSVRTPEKECVARAKASSSLLEFQLRLVFSRSYNLSGASWLQPGPEEPKNRLLSVATPSGIPASSA